MIYLKLFLSFFQVGILSFGGGYASLPLIEQQVVILNNWLTPEEFRDIVIISEMTPGPVAINSSTFVGTQIAGLPGSIVATLGCILPSCIIVILLAAIYMKYRELKVLQGTLSILRPCVVGLIASFAFRLILKSIFATEIFYSINKLEVLALVIFAISLFVLRKFKSNPILILGLSGVAGYLFYGLFNLKLAL